MAACSWLIRRLASAGEIKGVDSVAASAAYELKLEVVLRVVRRDFIYAYCVVVVAANWLRAAPLFVVVAARLSEWPSNWAM